MSAIYTRFLKLLERWPLDTTRAGRDLGDHIRKELEAALRAGNSQPVNTAYLEKQFSALNRIVNNVHSDKFKRRQFDETATGLNLELCKVGTSKAVQDIAKK